MTSTAPSTSSEMAASSTFSYAQAAKGQGTVPSNTATPQSGDSQVPAAAEKATSSDIDQASVPEPSSAAEGTNAQQAASEKRDVDESIPGSESDARSESVQDKRSESKRDDDASRLERPWRRNEKATRSTSSRSADDQDSRKNRRNKKGKNSDKQSGEQPATSEKEQEATPEPPKVELTEAPVPSVNIWHQRKEAHQAKGKPSSDSPAVNGSTGQDESKKSTEGAAPATAPHVNGVKPQQKATNVVRPERAGPRGSRSVEKDARDGKSHVPLSVEDSTAWPTPETAIKEIAVMEEKRKTSERSDRSDKDAQEDGSQSKPRQKTEWRSLDYVPTATFETQVQMRNSKPRGGGGPRSSRENTGRAAAAGVQDKAASTAPANKASETRRETNGVSQAQSQQAASKRASLDGANVQKKAPAASGADKPKDSAIQATTQTQPARERPEGRGRGAYRGRGAHHGNGQSQHAAGNSFGGRVQGPYSPPSRQGAHGQGFPPAQRGRGARNAAANNYHRMSLPNGNSRPPAVQPQFAPYDYGMAPVPAMPFQSPPYWDNMLFSMLKSQIEYYFSIENLCKDRFLRSHMDDQGFVPLQFIAGFKRLRDLCPDRTLIRAACEQSIELDFVVDKDDCEYLRRREGWEKFVLPLGERDKLAQSAGPTEIVWKNRPYAFDGQLADVHAAPYGAYQPYHGPSLAMNGMVNGLANGIPNGVVNGTGSTKLSADVPDFSPSGSVQPGTAEAEILTNGHIEPAAVNGVHADTQNA